MTITRIGVGPRMSQAVVHGNTVYLAGVVAGRTAICSLDGDLRYRGYSIGPLAEAGDFEDVAFLLLHGDLPTASERRDRKSVV